MSTVHDKRPIEERVAGLEGEMNHLSQQVSELARAMRQGFDSITNSTRTQWSPLIAAAAVVLTVGGAFFALVRDDIDRLERSISTLNGGTSDRWTATDQREHERDQARAFVRLEDKLDEHMSNGHPHTVMNRIDRLEKLLDEVRHGMVSDRKLP